MMKLDRATVSQVRSALSEGINAKVAEKVVTALDEFEKLINSACNRVCVLNDRVKIYADTKFGDGGPKGAEDADGEDIPGATGGQVGYVNMRLHDLHRALTTLEGEFRRLEGL